MKHQSIILSLFLAALLMGASSAFSKDWTKQQIPETAKGLDLFSISFPDSIHGWAVGEKGVILSTYDGGETWYDITANIRKEAAEAIPIPATLNLYSVMFVDSLTGWCAGEAILATMDPVGRKYGVIFHTDDGGLTWTCQYPELVVDSSDSQTSLGQTYLGRINHIHFSNRKNGWAVGNASSYLVTSDGGITWHEEWMNIFFIPEIKMAMTSCQLLSPCAGMISGYSFDMNSPEIPTGFVASTNEKDESCDIEWKFDWETSDGYRFPVLNDVDMHYWRAGRLTSWAAGEKGAILKRTPDGKWVKCNFPWPLSLSLPDFKGISFSDEQHGWAVGSFKRGLSTDPDLRPSYITIFRTTDAGTVWQPDAVNMEGRLNHITVRNSPHFYDDRASLSTDAWTVGDDGIILHYRNHAPSICSLNVSPGMVYAGEKFVLQARVDDLDNPFEDISSVAVDASSLGLGTIALEYSGAQERRCILYEAVIEVPPLARYGSHPLTVTVTDSDNYTDSAETSLFVVTSWVDITDTYAEPEKVLSGCSVKLNAKVILIAPKSRESAPSTYINQIESVEVNISDLMGIDCTDLTDCEAWIPMEYDPYNDIYTAKSPALVPGEHTLPTVATDSLGHIDRDVIKVSVVTGLHHDTDSDNDVDGIDLQQFIRSGRYRNPELFNSFCREYSTALTCATVQRISKELN